MVLKQLVNLKYFEKIISNIQRFEGLEEGKITWCSNYNRNCDRNVLGLEENKTTGFSSIMPFSYPRLIVLEAEEIAWRSNKLGIVSQ